MKKFFLLPVLFASLLCSYSAFSQGREKYELPPKEIQDLLLAPPVPHAVFCNGGRYGAVMEASSRYRPLSSILEAGECRVGGIRINSNNFSESRYFYNSCNIYLVDVQNGMKYSIEGLPEDASIFDLNWAPDGSCFCFLNLTGCETELYRVDMSERVARKINSFPVNSVFGDAYCILPDGSVLYKAVPDNLGEFPVQGDPTGPIVMSSNSKKRAYRTYQDLIKCEYDEKVFDYLCTTVFAHWDGKKTSIVSDPAIVRTYTVSPDGSQVISFCIEKPYSYSDTYKKFPSRTRLSSLDGTQTRILDTKKAGNWQWRRDRGATIVWTEKQDSLTVVYQSERIDSIPEGKQKIAVTDHALSSIFWGDETTALISVTSSKEKRRWLCSFDPSCPEKGMKELYSISTETDTTGLAQDPGKVYLYPGTKRVVMDGKAFFMTGSKRYDQNLDEVSFIDRVDAGTGIVTNVWTGRAPYVESVEIICGTRKGRTSFITLRESNKIVPQYCMVEARKGKEPSYRQITDFVNPYPALENLQDRYLTYTRADGVELTARLFLPAGYDSARDGRLPVLMLAYPWEHKCKAEAERHRAPRYTFECPAQTRIIHFATQGYAVVQDFAVPIISSSPSAESNENYLEHLVMSAEAVIDCLDSIGVADRKRIAVCGLSYGSFMTVNLMCHTKLFKLGIAESGAFNRTLTPYGFQHDNRSYWEIPDVYNKMSPFNYADKLSGHLILTHGITDENTGTHPIQSERMFQAIAGNGGDVEYIQFPWESHKLRFKETILHLNYVICEALGKFLAPKSSAVSSTESE